MNELKLGGQLVNAQQLLNEIFSDAARPSLRCVFEFAKFHTVRLVSRKGVETVEYAICPIKMGLKRVFQAPKLVAGAGFEPAIPPGRDYEPDGLARPVN